MAVPAASATATRLDTRYAAETPEGIALWLRPAGAVPRFYAYLIDILIRFAVFSVAFVALGVLGAFGMALATILFFALEWFYPVVFELSPGAATPGKRDRRPDRGDGQRPADHARRVAHPQPAARRRFPAVAVRRRRRCRCCSGATSSGSATSPPARSSSTPPRARAAARQRAAGGAAARARGAARRTRAGSDRRLGRPRAAAHRSARRRARRDRRAGRRAAGDARRPRRGARRRRPLAARPAMTPLQFEAQHAPAWQELEAALAPPRAARQARTPADRSRAPRRALPRDLRAPGDRRVALLPGRADRAARDAHRARPPAHLSADRLRPRRAAPAVHGRLPERRARASPARADRARRLRRAADRRRRAHRRSTPASCSRCTTRDAVEQYEQMYGDERRPDRPAHRRVRLGDVRLLHRQQRRHRLPVLRRRPVLRHRQPLLPRPQRRARRQRRRLRHLARLRRELLSVRDHARRVRAHRHRSRRRRRAGARPRAARSRPALAPGRARARGAARDRDRLRHDARCSWSPPRSRRSGRRRAGSRRRSSSASARRAGSPSSPTSCSRAGRARRA